MNALTLVKKLAAQTLVVAIAISLSAVQSHAQTAGPSNFGGGSNTGGANFGGRPNMGGAGFGGGAGMGGANFGGGAGMEIFGGAKADDKSDEYVYEYDFSKFEAPKGNAPSAAVPEPTSTAGLLVISAFGAAALIKRKQRLSNKA